MAVDERRSFSFMTKTQHYRKITKPLLERKRRARMNLYIDELKDLIVDTMEAQGEQVAKWEKADILEMTVNYLKMQRHQNFQQEDAVPPHCEGNGGGVNLEKFRAGYTQAAYDVSKIFASLPGLDLKFTTRLMQHLGGRLKELPKKPQHQKQSATETAVINSTITKSPHMNEFKPALEQQQQQQNQQHHTHHFQRVEPQALQLKEEVVWRPW